jgi:uncharacterized circularly permuted ATP-grasp superfamily protein
MTSSTEEILDITKLFDDYQTIGSAWDGMLADDVTNELRARFRPIRDTFAKIASTIPRRAELLASQYLDQGVTFDFAGIEQPFPLDIVPRIIKASEWEVVKNGVPQRIRALEAFLEDVYTEQRCIKDGVIPASHLISSPELLREAWNVPMKASNGVRIHVAGIDLVRDKDSKFKVLEDNVRVPSGVSYVLSNRRAMVQIFPEMFSDIQVLPVDDYPRRLLRALIKAAPHGNHDPNVVILTPGVYNSAYYEHSLLARLMGVPLVEGRDLFCSGGRVYVHTTKGPQRVDVIYRRVDDQFIDPVHFKIDSILGVPGLLNAANLGNVTIANAIGNGIADDKLTYTYIPDFIRYYLSEEPIIDNVETIRLEDKTARDSVFANMREFVIKPVNSSGGKGIVVGSQATDSEIFAAIEAVEQHPRNWIAQPIITLSTSPTWIPSTGRFEPRHVDLRPFAINSGEDIWVLPGGLTRVALPRGELIVNSSQGGGSKDTWVLSDEAPATARPIVDVVLDAADKISKDGLSNTSSGSSFLTLPIISNPKDLEEIDYIQQQQQQQQQIAAEGGGVDAK